jgi:hypothetical protein
MTINKIMKNLRYLVMIMAAMLMASCDKAGQKPEEPQNGASGFKIEVFDMNSSHCKVKVVPEDKTKPYFCGVATEDYLKTFGPLDDMLTTATNFIETTILENSDLAISDLMKVGEYQREVTGLKPEQKFVVFACHTDETGAVTSEVAMVIETTPALEQVQMEFEIELDQITATSAMLFITPTTDDEYVWLEFPEDVYRDMTMEELQEFLLKNYKPFFPLHTNMGEMVHSFDDKLDPDTEYMIIVFGYDGGLTTPLFTEKFRTLKPNDPTDVTFEITYSNLTARSASVTFKPSDASVAYLAIVAGEDELERNGGPTAEGVKKLIDKEIKKAILVGDCEDRAEFAKYYAQRGTATGSFSLKPGMRHYACAVCLDSEGEYASEVAICWFDAPQEGTTDASVSASVLKYFDGDALYAADPSYSDFAGWAVVRLKFVLGGSATDAIFTIYPVDVLEQEGATDEDIRAMLLDDSLLGEYNFNIEALTEVQLEWGYDYRLYAIPFDGAENTGELFKLDIPALSKAGASPVSEY